MLGILQRFSSCHGFEKNSRFQRKREADFPNPWILNKHLFFYYKKVMPGKTGEMTERALGPMTTKWTDAKSVTIMLR